MDKSKSRLSAFFRPLLDPLHEQYIKYVPSYGNSFFFTIGIYLLEIFVILGITGTIMLIFGPYWWDLNPVGVFLRSMHLWAAEAFVTLLFLHVIVNFSTSAFKKKQLIWIIGSALLLLVFLEFAFGLGVEGGLISQWNDKAGADLWNGLGLGFWVNPLNQGAVLGWHVAILPIVLLMLIFLHYSLVRKKGLSLPYRKDISYKIVKADHARMYRRMIYIFIIILLFAVIFSSPYIPPLTISQVANQSPNTVAVTLLQEFNHSSGTATYLDTIDPYTFNTANVYVLYPYSVYANLTGKPNQADILSSLNSTSRVGFFAGAYSYFENNGSVSSGLHSDNPLISAVSGLVVMAQSGAYESTLQSEAASGLDETYVLRFLYDTGALDRVAAKYGLRTSQYGVLKVGAPPWSLEYWMVPYNLMEIETANIPWWGDLENGMIAFLIFLVFMFLPFIPYLNEVPDKLKLYKIFWNRHTNPEMRKKRGNKK